MTVQNVVVMRHGDRIDWIEPTWIKRADRPWDPPLVPAGKIRAWTAGKKLRSMGFPIHRVFVSPFRRCLQTAAEVVVALCAVVNDEDDGRLHAMQSSDGVVIDPARVKVSIEYGLCEIFGGGEIPPSRAPKDGKWFPDISELEAQLPAGTIDHSADRVYKTMPKWGESTEDARRRFEEVFVALADKFPRENLLLITHGEGVEVSVSAFSENMRMCGPEFCAHVHLQRKVSFKSEGFPAETLKMVGDSRLGYINRSLTSPRTGEINGDCVTKK